MPTWVDFRTLRQQLSFEQVLRLYEVEIKARGKQHHGYCPLPTHNGKKNSPSFSAHLERGIFHCFGCGGSGNALDFAVLMDGGNPKEPEDVRKTALKLQKRFGLGNATKPQPKPTPPPPASPKAGLILVNAALDFELKTLDYKHPYLRTRGFTEATIEAFELGYCDRGYLEGRVAIPLHDSLGRLIGYAGRIVDEMLIDEKNPRYKFPGTRERRGIVHEFQKTAFLYNGFRLKGALDDLVVVEGFPSVWWLHQSRITNVVALMGWSMSEAQAKLITTLVKPTGRVWLMADGDESGNRCAEAALPLISPKRFVRWVKLDPGKQPTDYRGNEIRALLNQ